MAIIIVEPNQKLSKEDFEKAREEYNSYIKITIDLEEEITALGGEYHADAEEKLLKIGSKQKNIWGGGINLKLKVFEAKAMINLRPTVNYSNEILDTKIRSKFFKVAKKVLKKYVAQK